MTVTIRRTLPADLPHLLALWNNGDVMKYVAFPDGLGAVPEAMPDWLSWVESGRPALRDHFSIYDDETYCGECFYAIDTEHEKLARVDIKLLPQARGRGVGRQGLMHAVRAALHNGAARVCVDPHPDNREALALYARVGFVRAQAPAHIRASWDVEYPHVYMELTPDLLDSQLA